MDSSNFKILFSGQVQPGYDADQVRANLGKLLKMEAAGLDQLFSGRLITLKKDLDQVSASKYQKVLENAGARILIQQGQGNASVAQPAKQTPAEVVPVVAAESKPKPKAKVNANVASASEVPGEKPVPAATSKQATAEGEIQCPRCHHSQPRADECGHCKMDMRRHIMRVERKAKAREARRSANG